MSEQLSEQQLALFKAFCRDQKKQKAAQDVDDSEEGSSEASSPPPEKKKKDSSKNDNFLWKLTKGKFLLTFYLCRACQDKLFRSADKTVRNGDDSGVMVKLVLCSECVDMNIMATNVLAPKKKVEDK